MFRDVPVFRCSGVPVFRCSGVPVFRCSVFRVPVFLQALLAEKLCCLRIGNAENGPHIAFLLAVCRSNFTTVFPNQLIKMNFRSIDKNVNLPGLPVAEHFNAADILLTMLLYVEFCSAT